MNRCRESRGYDTSVPPRTKRDLCCRTCRSRSRAPTLRSSSSRTTKGGSTGWCRLPCRRKKVTPKCFRTGFTLVKVTLRAGTPRARGSPYKSTVSCARRNRDRRGVGWSWFIEVERFGRSRAESLSWRWPQTRARRVRRWIILPARRRSALRREGDDLEWLRRSGDVVSQRRHVWKVIMQLTQPATASGQPAFESWYGEGDVFARVPAKGVRRGIRGIFTRRSGRRGRPVRMAAASRNPPTPRC